MVLKIRICLGVSNNQPGTSLGQYKAEGRQVRERLGGNGSARAGHSSQLYSVFTMFTCGQFKGVIYADISLDRIIDRLLLFGVASPLLEKMC